MAFLDTVINALKPDEQAAREQLEILKRAATGVLTAYQSDLNNRMLNPKAFPNEIVPYKMFEHIEDYRVDLNEDASKQVGSIVNTFLVEGNIRQGFTDMIKLALDSILGSKTIGEQSTKNWYVAMELGAVIRVDVMAWRYNFTSKGVIATTSNAFCFTATKSFVDSSTLNKQELIYFLSKSLGLSSVSEVMENENLKLYVDYIASNMKPMTALESAKHYDSQAGTSHAATFSPA